VPLGLVPKKDVDEPFRVIADGRQMNEYMLPWKTKMTDMSASAGMFVRGSYAFLRDFSSAYHNVPLGTPCNHQCAGCRPCRGALDPHNPAPPSPAISMGHSAPDPATTPFKPDSCRWEQTGLQQVLGDLRPVVPTDHESATSRPTAWRQARFVGCQPGQNCNPTTCQKQLFGFRFAVAHFGIKTSGNAFHALLSPLIRHWKITHNVRIILWVDDIYVIVPNFCQQQDTCGGADTCEECARCKTRAWELDKQFTKDIKALGSETNRKDVPPTTSAFFLGLGFDTVTLEFWVPLEKAQAFADECKDLFEKGKATRREIAALVGKLMWWNLAISNAKLLSKTLQQQTGGIDGAQLWDEVVQFSQLALRELQFWVHNTVEIATRRKPMILPRFEDLEIEWARLESGGSSGLQWFCLSLGRPGL